jgi:TPR repeat protein
MDMHWNRMLWWMGAVLLLACLLLSNRSMSQEAPPARVEAAAKSPDIAEGASLQGVPGQPDAVAFAAFIKRAQNGEEPASCLLGMMYVLGVGVDIDDERSKLLLTDHDAERRNSYLKSLLEMAQAVMLSTRIVDDQGRLLGSAEEDRQTYESLVRMVRRSGNRGAQLALGVIYANGMGTKQDLTQAALWVRRAAEQGDPLAEGLLGMMYETGMGVPVGKSESTKWYARAEAHPSVNMSEGRELAEELAQITLLYIENRVTALQKSAENGNAEAQFQLGEFYEEWSEGALVNVSLIPFHLASGEADSANKRRNEQMAYFWYKKAALQGHADAQYALGEMYEDGQVGDSGPDRQKALKWYKKAAEQRNLDAIKKVAELRSVIPG